MVRRVDDFRVGLGERSGVDFGAAGRLSICRGIAPSFSRSSPSRVTKGRFSDIAGKPRQGDFHATDLALPGWQDCSLYGASTYTCNSAEVDTAEQAEAAQAAILQEIKTCLGVGWSRGRRPIVTPPCRLAQRPAPGLDHAEHGCNRQQNSCRAPHRVYPQKVGGGDDHTGRRAIRSTIRPATPRR